MSEKTFATWPCGSTTTSGLPLSPAAESCKWQRSTTFLINTMVYVQSILIPISWCNWKTNFKEHYEIKNLNLEIHYADKELTSGLMGSSNKWGIPNCCTTCKRIQTLSDYTRSIRHVEGLILLCSKPVDTAMSVSYCTQTIVRISESTPHMSYKYHIT